MGSAAAATTTDWETTLKEFTAPGAGGVQGVILKAVDKNGNIFYDKAVGLHSLKDDATPIDPNGVFWIASCTKLLASIAGLQLVERGLFTLDEPVSRILTELASPQIITEDESAPEGFTLRPATKQITLRQLITHSSGVSYEWMNALLQKWRKSQPPVPKEKLGTTVATYSLPLLFEPGEGWTYGGGLDWVGELVFRLTGKTLGAYLEENVFKPLGGLDSTTFDLHEKPGMEERIVGCSKRTADGGLEHTDYVGFPKRLADHSGGGGLWSSAPDYLKVLQDLVKDEPTILKRETVEELMFKPQLNSDAALHGLVGARAISANTTPAEAGVTYALGGLLLTKDSEALPKDTLTWGGLPNLKWFVNRRLGIAALYASQVLPPGDPKSTQLSTAYFQEVVKLGKEQGH